MTPGATSAVERSSRERHRDDTPSPEQSLRLAAVVFAVALAVHGADRLRRGMDVVTPTVRVAGGIQLLLGLITLVLVLVFRRHPWAPPAAVAVGFASAIGFTAAHLLPHWSSFSDSFTGSHVAPNVTALSWPAALFELGADVVLGWAGLRVLGIDGRHAPASTA